MRVGRYMMGALYVVAGVGHFLITRTYVHIMPDYLPAHRELVLLSGAAEIAGGLGVMVPQTRRAAAWGLVVLLIVVMPANVWMAQHPERYPGIPLWAIWLRLPLQVPLVWWAWLYTRREQERQWDQLAEPTLGELIGNEAAANCELYIEPRQIEDRAIDLD